MVKKNTKTSKGILLIGVGGAGITIAKGMLDNSFDCDQHLFVGSSEWIKELPDSERLYFDYENDDESHSVSEVRDMLRRPERAFIKEKFKGMNTLILTVGLGGMTGGYSALVISDMAVEQELNVVVLAAMPFSFESRERQMNAEGQLQLLRKNTRLLLVPNDIISTLCPEKTSMLEALNAMNLGLTYFVSALMMQCGQPCSCCQDNIENTDD